MTEILDEVITALRRLRDEAERGPVRAQECNGSFHQSSGIAAALDEQCEKLRLLTARVEAQSAYESELRALLLQAHEDILRHDHDLQLAMSALLNDSEAPELVRSGAAHNGWCRVRPRGTGKNKRLRYRQIVKQVQQTVAEKVPAHATVIVISKGDEELLKLGTRSGWHFPQTDDGTYAGHYPADSAAAIGHLEVLRSRGGMVLLIPSTGFWWLDHYQDFKRHLETRFTCIHRDEHCLLYELSAAVV